jgi:hypothetical protein
MQRAPSITISPEMSRSAIFVSYRRHGEADAVGRICDRLIDRFGSSSVFQDVNDIPAGADFGVHILEKIAECRVLLAMIDPDWAASVLGKQHDQDWVREELVAAQHFGLLIVPVLLDNTQLPRANELPEPLRWLTSLEAVNVRGGRDFRTDFEHLAEQLSRHVPAKPGARGAAVDLWEELKSSVEVDALERFVETFNNTREAYDARGRLKQLKQVLKIRELMDPWNYSDCVEDEEQADLFFEVLKLVDDFLDAPATEWHVEVERERETLGQLARETSDQVFCYNYAEHQEERRLQGKPVR